MFTQKPKNEDKLLQENIDRLHVQMFNFPPDSDEFAKISDQLSKLYSLKETPQGVSPDTMAVVTANLLGIVLIIGYERMNVVTSKALNFVMKLR